MIVTDSAPRSGRRRDRIERGDQVLPGLPDRELEARRTSLTARTLPVEVVGDLPEVATELVRHVGKRRLQLLVVDRLAEGVPHLREVVRQVGVQAEQELHV